MLNLNINYFKNEIKFEIFYFNTSKGFLMFKKLVKIGKLGILGKIGKFVSST